MNKEYLDIGFEIKQDGITEKGIFQGLGSTFGGEPDSYGDVIEEGAFSESLQKNGRNGNGIAMLWQHNHDMPVGVWKEIRETKSGLEMTGQLALNTTAGKDAYELMKLEAIKGLSIGFNLNKDGAVYDEEKKVRVLKSINLWEVSLVTFPANINATITGVKAFEDVKTKRDLERVLRESGLSKKAALYICSMIKEDSLSESRDDSLSKIKEALQLTRINNNLIK